MPTNQHILVDFLIPQFQDPRITTAIESITAHPEADRFRVIVLDGGSDSALHARIATCLRPHDIHDIAPDRGIYDALNRGLARSDAPWIGWLGSDDLLARTFTSRPLADATSATAFVAFTTLFFRASDRKVTRVYAPVGMRALRMAGFHLPHFSTFIRTAIARSIQFDIERRNFADQLYFQTLESRFRGTIRAEVATLMCEGGASNSSAETILHTNLEVMRALRSRLGTFGASGYVVAKLAFKIWQILLAELLQPQFLDHCPLPGEQTE